MSKMAKRTHATSPSPIFSEASRLLRVRLESLISLESCLGNERRVVELHEMRLAAKRLRYSQELFLPLYKGYSRYGAEFNASIKQMKRLQELLGNIHDADLMVPRITERIAFMVENGFGMNDAGEPVAGVRLIDLDSCQGAVALCLEIRNEREAWFQELLMEWDRLKKNGCFENFISLLETAEEETKEPDDTLASNERSNGARSARLKTKNVN